MFRPRSDRTLIIVLVAVVAITGVISSLGAPLIPSVARTMHVSLDDAQWSLTVTLLMACVASPIMGRLSDGPHRRATILAGLMIVLVGSVVAGLAHSLGVLVSGRAMQGVGMGLAPVSMAAAKDHLSPQRSPGVIAILSVSGAAAVGAGYPISGLINAQFGLHAAFFFGAVLSAGALIAAAMVIPSSRARSHHTLDYVGASVLTIALVALVLAISEGERWGWGSTRILGLFVVAIVAFSIWIPQQFRQPWPLVNLRLLRHRSVMTANLAGIILGVALYMYLSLVTELDPAAQVTWLRPRRLVPAGRIHAVAVLTGQPRGQPNARTCTPATVRQRNPRHRIAADRRGGSVLCARPHRALGRVRRDGGDRLGLRLHLRRPPGDDHPVDTQHRGRLSDGSLSGHPLHRLRAR